MIWENTGFEYEGLWKNNEPADEIGSLHPHLQVLSSDCSSKIIGSSKDYGQFLFDCQDCKLSFCSACYLECHDVTHQWIKKWHPGMSCQCAEEPKKMQS